MIGIVLADGWAANKARYYMQPEGDVSQYEFNFEAAVAAFRYHKFEAYDREWLHFIVSNRQGGGPWFTVQPNMYEYCVAPDNSEVRIIIQNFFGVRGQK